MFLFSCRFACYDVIISAVKLHTGNNACILCASVSRWACLFLQHLRRRSLWIIHETADRWIPPPHVKFFYCSLALRFVFLTQQQWLNCVDVSISTRTASVAVCRLFRTLPAACWCYSSSNLRSEILFDTASNWSYFRCPVWKTKSW